MEKTPIKQDPQVENKFNSYPPDVRPKLEYLRDLIIRTASEMDIAGALEISLKWGEPSFKVKKGSPIRIGWNSKNPDQYAMYFVCTTSLIETFRMVYGDLFRYEKNRAIVFNMNDDIPLKELKDCILMAMDYKSLKDKSFLGR